VKILRLLYLIAATAALAPLAHATDDATDDADYHLVSAGRPEAATPEKSRSACVGEDGSWKNWSWPNVPTLSPRCKRRR